MAGIIKPCGSHISYPLFQKEKEKSDVESGLGGRMLVDDVRVRAVIAAAHPASGTRQKPARF
jgi:hypothetical protein